MHNIRYLISLGLMLAALFNAPGVLAERQPIKAIYVPLADHYAGIVAYEKYRDRMQYADYSIKRMTSWMLLRAYFLSGEVDMAFTMSPLAMDMFRESPNFRWISLLHRDGNAMAINGLINEKVKLSAKRSERKPDGKVADALGEFKRQRNKPTEVGVPHLQATHTVVLYKYLKDHGRTLALGRGNEEDVVAVAVAPSKSPVYLRKKNNRGQPAAFEQSLPWADVVETHNFGHVAWYSRDVLPWPKGHVECIAIAQDTTIADKREALKEVIFYIHKAGEEIEQARSKGGEAIREIAAMVRKHIPQHNEEAIIQSLRSDLNVINYHNLNNDEAGLKQVMDLAVESGIISAPIDIRTFSDRNFGTED
ncbi:MAG: ABC transporter substrate-binding protein [Candidatus Thiodiazotropha sp. (ex Lucinoma kastoroae)]|nr:ABC transporter substrate-binding protein [Candidatus Thiodiazotropha sp. (ex Lucinoma kastoroae)]MCU7860118.1 ABC transporter substrate-binding protein [Candidatus Thiodiazotropha sp. (ex Lucinoma kastoroae)]